MNSHAKFLLAEYTIVLQLNGTNWFSMSWRNASCHEEMHHKNVVILPVVITARIECNPQPFMFRAKSIQNPRQQPEQQLTYSSG